MTVKFIPEGHIWEYDHAGVLLTSCPNWEKEQENVKS